MTEPVRVGPRHFSNLPAHSLGMSTNTSANHAFGRARTPKGAPAGGQFAAESKTEPPSSLPGDGPPTRDTSPEAIAASLVNLHERPNTNAFERLHDNPDCQRAVAVLSDVVEARHPNPTMPASVPIVSSGEARARAREALPNLPDGEFDYRWGRVEQAQAKATMFADPSAADEVVPNLRDDEEIIDSWHLGDDRERYVSEASTVWQECAENAAWEAAEANWDAS